MGSFGRFHSCKFRRLCGFKKKHNRVCFHNWRYCNQLDVQIILKCCSFIHISRVYWYCKSKQWASIIEESLIKTWYATGRLCIALWWPECSSFGKESVFHNRTKHIEMRFSFIHELISDGTLNLKKIPGTKNPIDMFTKVVTVEKLKLWMASTGLPDTWIEGAS